MLPKNPAQHAADYDMLEKTALSPAFLNPATNDPKDIECITVELQNGCSALGGTISQQRLKANMDTATDIYISDCNGALCGESVIHPVKGADFS